MSSLANLAYAQNPVPLDTSTLSDQKEALGDEIDLQSLTFVVSGTGPLETPTGPISGKLKQQLNRPMRWPRITGLISCTYVPPDFGHTGSHGPCPHTIRVIVRLPGAPETRSGSRLNELAREAEALAAFLRARAAAEGKAVVC